MTATYGLHRGGTNQYHWDLKSGNGEPILSSELYNQKQSAEGGIRSCRENSPIEARYRRLTAKDGKPYFVAHGRERRGNRCERNL